MVPPGAKKNKLSSPLGWSAGARMIWATGASLIIWLCVAWAIGG